MCISALKQNRKSFEVQFFDKYVLSKKNLQNGQKRTINGPRGLKYRSKWGQKWQKIIKNQVSS